MRSLHLQEDNTFTAVGTALSLVGKYFAGGQLLQSGSSQLVRTWAIVPPGGNLTIILLNKALTPTHQVPVIVALKDPFSHKASGPVLCSACEPENLYKLHDVMHCLSSCSTLRVCQGMKMIARWLVCEQVAWHPVYSVAMCCQSPWITQLRTPN